MQCGTGHGGNVLGSVYGPMLWDKPLCKSKPLSCPPLIHIVRMNTLLSTSHAHGENTLQENINLPGFLLVCNNFSSLSSCCTPIPYKHLCQPCLLSSVTCTILSCFLQWWNTLLPHSNLEQISLVISSLFSQTSSREVCDGGWANTEPGNPKQSQDQLPHHRVCGRELWCYCASKELLCPFVQVSEEWLGRPGVCLYLSLSCPFAVLVNEGLNE